MNGFLKDLAGDVGLPTSKFESDGEYEVFRCGTLSIAFGKSKTNSDKVVMRLMHGDGTLHKLQMRIECYDLVEDRSAGSN